MITPPFIRRLAVPVLGVLWLVAVVAGSGALWRHANTPGHAGRTPAAWPAESSLIRAAHRKTLVMFAHPQCPCTRASIGELALLMARCGGDLDAFVVFFKPEDAAEEWTHTGSFRDAAAIPGVTVLLDRQGREAERFGAATSGQTDFYDADGRLLFSGGITAARGHAGDNPGRAAIGQWAADGPAGCSSTPVFGCALTEARAP
ncbi:MAG TPA: hypothetical protein VGO11_02360 [Chthoniobacteraceae bacterium]|jgi:hypothetical protein|nr:hypothetical protein [Chthoniobacteraceae bacterium]